MQKETIPPSATGVLEFDPADNPIPNGPVRIRRKFYVPLPSNPSASTEFTDEILVKRYDDAVAYLEYIFKTNPDIARLESVKYADGSESVSIKGRDNKIILQYKTITDENI